MLYNFILNRLKGCTSERDHVFVVDWVDGRTTNLNHDRGILGAIKGKN